MIIVVCTLTEHDCSRLMSGKNSAFFLKKKKIICSLLGINIFLDGFVPTENLRFRESSLVFKVAETADKVSNVLSKQSLYYH